MIYLDEVKLVFPREELQALKKVADQHKTTVAEFIKGATYHAIDELMKLQQVIKEVPSGK